MSMQLFDRLIGQPNALRHQVSTTHGMGAHDVCNDARRRTVRQTRRNAHVWPVRSCQHTHDATTCTTTTPNAKRVQASDARDDTQIARLQTVDFKVQCVNVPNDDSYCLGAARKTTSVSGNCRWLCTQSSSKPSHYCSSV